MRTKNMPARKLRRQISAEFRAGKDTSEALIIAQLAEARALRSKIRRAPRAF